MIQKRQWVQALAEAADLGEELFPGMPVVEIAGTRRVTVEGHNGVTEFASTEISMNISYGLLKVCGTDLVIAKMTQHTLVILGTITDVHMVQR